MFNDNCVRTKEKVWEIEPPRSGFLCPVQVRLLARNRHLGTDNYGATLVFDFSSDGTVKTPRLRQGPGILQQQNNTEEKCKLFFHGCLIPLSFR